MRVRLTIEYDGTGFRGWAAQPELRTVEGVVRAALDAVYPAWSGLRRRSFPGVYTRHDGERRQIKECADD